ncbi:hypothetical protein WA1_38140 [Scytonema hofmannii PCC 7110]|uniref:Uncharacterized protein n=1 Tax=Scytonema hofmannii PCC 7110 TaxID=128403 RepID=A0A139X0F5_9CYAN|nr:hypothetical protein [Scytonema hofmannii]KYC38168.1 hypothetical protein WA1_38140 [Scytonema hofmannii PCC 7110]
MEIQTVLYIYSFPTYLREQPRVKIGKTSGSIAADRDLINNGVLNGTPQRMHSLPLERCKKAIELGGLYAG